MTMHVRLPQGQLLSRKKKRIFLHGYMGDLFGHQFDLAVRSPAEAVRLLEANFRGKFANALRDGRFQIICKGRDELVEGSIYCSLDMVNFNFPMDEIHFVPVPQGAKSGASKGILTIVLGVALIATAFIGAAVAGGFFAAEAGTLAFGAAAFGGVSFGQIGMLGLALTLAGVSQLLTPAPKTQDAAPADQPSFFFNGAINSTQEGNCVPLVYGHIIAGSVTVMGGLFAEAFDPTSVGIAPSLELDKLNGRIDGSGGVEQLSASNPSQNVTIQGAWGTDRS